MEKEQCFDSWFCRPRENVFFRRVKEIGALLGQVNQAKML